MQKIPKPSPAQFVLAVLVTGISWHTGWTFLCNLGFNALSQTIFYGIQRKFLPGIVRMAENVARRNRSQLEPGATLGIDGSWNHRRNASECIVDMYDCKTGKIVDFEIVSKGDRHHPGNYDGSSNGMEVAGFRKMVGRWANGNDRVANVVTDQDSKLGRAISESGWNVNHLIDTNHASKSFARQWDDLKPPEKKLLYGLKDRLMKWLKTVLYSKETQAKKLAMWENSAKHYSGDHSGCRDRNHTGYQWRESGNPEAQQVLGKMITAGSSLIRKCNPNLGSTQGNESFHAVKAKYADKRLNYAVSTQARFAMAVIEHSNYPGWQNELRKNLGVEPLPKNFQNMLAKETENRITRSANRRTEEYRRKTNAMRQARQANNRNDTRGKNDYGHGA